jgi:hypothetical protein
MGDSPDTQAVLMRYSCGNHAGRLVVLAQVLREPRLGVGAGEYRPTIALQGPCNSRVSTLACGKLRKFVVLRLQDARGVASG